MGGHLRLLVAALAPVALKVLEVLNLCLEFGKGLAFRKFLSVSENGNEVDEQADRGVRGSFSCFKSAEDDVGYCG